MFEAFQKNKYFYVALISLFLVSSYIGTKYGDAFKPNHDEYDLIKNYLLNDSPLYGFNRPKIWIHTKYEYNARRWKSFQSRSSYDLNQPYIHLTIKTIIDHCGDDFHICLIDDNTFSKLIPSWTTDLASVAEPMKSQLRQIGLAELVYYYGGVVLPNSFVCCKSLIEIYNSAISENKPFVAESVNHNENLLKNPQRLAFLPDTYIMGAKKNDETIKDLIEYLKTRSRSVHFSSDRDFLGDTSQWCMNAIRAQRMTLLGGEYVGVKTRKGRPILLDHLMEEQYLDLSPTCVGIYIPENEILSRKKHQWFAVMPTNDLMNTDAAITKCIKSALVDGAKEMYSNPGTEQVSVTSI